ncbi:transposase [bacterium]|nr:transposase [bacterium]
MARPRSACAAEFQLRAARMATDQKRSVAEAARQLDVGDNLLRDWRKAFLARTALSGHCNPSPAYGERRLRAEAARLKAEWGLLK